MTITWQILATFIVCLSFILGIVVGVLKLFIKNATSELATVTSLNLITDTNLKEIRQIRTDLEELKHELVQMKDALIRLMKDEYITKEFFQPRYDNLLAQIAKIDNMLNFRSHKND